MRNSEALGGRSTAPLKTIKAVSSPVRLEILSLLKDPVANFPPQTDGDLVRDGVCADFIRDKLGISPATASRQKGWTFYRRDDKAIRLFTELLKSEL
jgi:hypothetical protein